MLDWVDITAQLLCRILKSLSINVKASPRLVLALWTYKVVLLTLFISTAFPQGVCINIPVPPACPLKHSIFSTLYSRQLSDSPYFEWHTATHTLQREQNSEESLKLTLHYMHDGLTRCHFLHCYGFINYTDIVIMIKNLIPLCYS